VVGDEPVDVDGLFEVVLSRIRVGELELPPGVVDQDAFQFRVPLSWVIP
jgi:hypothetical protein